MDDKVISLLHDLIKKEYDLDIKDIKLETPPKKELWDFAFWAFLLSRDLKRNPNQIANELLEKITSYELIDSASVEWPYLNIFINKAIFNDLFTNIYLDDYYKDISNIGNKKNIVVDYIGANVWKPLHIGHMCTPNQWQAMINVYKKLWYNVISDSHIWDWWIIFGKLITAYKIWWNESDLKSNAVDYLLNLYVKITSEIEKEWNNSDLEQKTRDEFKLLSSWNNDSIDLWTKFTSYSIDAMNYQLSRLKVKPDYNIGESFYEWLWLPKMEDYPDLEYDMHSIVDLLINKWIATKNSDNSVWVVFDEESKIPSCILQKRDGTHWYLASDLAAIKYRVDNWNPEKIIYFVDVRQQMHLKQAFEISKQAWFVNDTELFHAYNWFITLKDWAMSSRKGRIIKLDLLLDESEKRAKDIILEKRDDISWSELDQLSKTIWVWAIKYWYLKKSRENDVVFDWDEFMTFEWNSWPYIQYAYVRSINILKNYDQDIDSVNHKIIFESDEETDLIKQISNYKEILLESTKTNSPHLICKYAYSLTKSFNSFYNNIHILNEENFDKKISRLKLVKLFWFILKDTFSILWIDMPNKM